MAATTNYIDNDCEGEENLVGRNYKSKRNCTDLHHLFMFGMFFTLWIGIAIHGLTAGHHPMDFIRQEDYERAMNEISNQLSKNGNVCATFIWLGILFLALYYIAIRFLTKYVVYATILMASILLTGLFFLSIFSPANVFKPFYIIIMIVCLLLFGLELYILKEVGCKTVCIIVRDSCRAMTSQLSCILIVITCNILMGLVGCFTFLVIFGLLTIHQVHRSSHPPNSVYFLLFAFASCSLWILTVIYNVGRASMYGIFSTWYRSADKTTIPRTMSLRITYTTLRYHLGTVTFGSTIFTFVQIIRTICNSWIDLYGKFKSRKITIYCFLDMLIHATSNTFVVCINNGTGYYRSMENSFKVLMKNPLKFSAVRNVTEWMILFGSTIIPVLTTLFACLYIIPNADYYAPPLVPIYIILITSILITAFFLEIFHAATTAILYCFLEDLSSKQIEDDYSEDQNIPGCII